MITLSLPCEASPWRVEICIQHYHWTILLSLLFGRNIWISNLASGYRINERRRSLMPTVKFSDSISYLHQFWRLLLELKADDVKNMTSKFWQFHSDPILFRDTGAMTNITIQYNPALGTLLDLGSEKPELQHLIKGILNYTISLVFFFGTLILVAWFDWCISFFFVTEGRSQFLLTELGHGLDVINMETTATLLPSGEFDLHSPNEKAAK